MLQRGGNDVPEAGACHWRDQFVNGGEGSDIKPRILSRGIDFERRSAKKSSGRQASVLAEAAPSLAIKSEREFVRRCRKSNAVRWAVAFKLEVYLFAEPSGCLLVSGEGMTSSTGSAVVDGLVGFLGL